MEGDVPDLPRMALLWRHLPGDSRCARLDAPQLAWRDSEYLLCKIEHDIRMLSWGLGYDKRNPTSAPEPIRTPADLAEAHRNRDAAIAARGEIDAVLGMGAEIG